MQLSIIKLVGPAFVASLILLLLDSVGVPLEFIIAGALFVGWVLGRTVEV